MNRNTYRGKRSNMHDVHKGEWVYGDLIGGQAISTLDPEKYYLHNCETGRLECDGTWAINPATLGQCTGLQDKNGRDIFQGDIVRATAQDSHDGKYEETLWVQWVDEVCGFVGLCETARRDEFYVSLMGYDSIEVIGNVHDTPNLLKGVRG